MSASESTNMTDETNHRESNGSEKYKTALKLINKILINIGKEEVDDLIKFINIDRDDIVKENNKTTLESMEKEIFALYDKKKCGYYRKTNGIVLNCLRGMMKEIGYEFTYVQKEKSEYVNNKSFRRKHVFYSIK